MICRLCLVDLNLEKSVPLFNEFGSKDEPQLVKIILKYLHLDITWSDEISTAICQECSKHLNEFDKYCVYVGEQQIMLSHKVLVGHRNAEKIVDAVLTVEPVEMQVKCASEEDILGMEAVFKCEPEETVLAEMALLSNAGSSHSNSSSYSKHSSSSNFHGIVTNGSAQILEQHYIDDNSTSYGCISDSHVDSLPDADTIKNLQPLQEIYKSYSMGKSLKNKDRIQIAKSVIDECLKDTPAKLYRQDLEKLAENIKEVFPSEIVSIYYNPSMLYSQPTGKLYNAYTHKRFALTSRGKINKTSANISLTKNKNTTQNLRNFRRNKSQFCF